MHRIAWRRVALGHPWQPQHIQRRDDVKICGWPELGRTRDAVFAHLPVAQLGRGLVPRYPLQKPPSRGLEGSGGEGGGGRRSEGRRGLHLRKASRGLQGGLKGASRGLEGGFTFGRLQGGLKGASSLGLEAPLKPPSSPL